MRKCDEVSRCKKALKLYYCWHLVCCCVVNRLRSQKIKKLQYQVSRANATCGIDSQSKSSTQFTT